MAHRATCDPNVAAHQQIVWPGTADARWAFTNSSTVYTLPFRIGLETALMVIVTPRVNSGAASVRMALLPVGADAGGPATLIANTTTFGLLSTTVPILSLNSGGTYRIVPREEYDRILLYQRSGVSLDVVFWLENRTPLTNTNRGPGG